MVIKPISKSYVMYQGTTFITAFGWSIPGLELVTGCKAAMQIRPNIKSDIVICEATTENNKIKIFVVEQQIQVIIPATETESFNFEKAVYDIEVEFPNGYRFRIAQGVISLNPEVTRGV